MRNCLGRSGGCRRDRRAWPRCRWAAGPGRTTSRRAEPPIIDPAPLVWRAPEGSAAVPVGGGRARTKQKSHIISYGHFWRPPRNVAIATTLLHDLKYPQGNYVRNWRGGIAERQGLAAVPVGGGGAWPGFEIDHSERSSRVAISRAGRRPPAHTAAGPDGARNTRGAISNQPSNHATETRGSPRGPPRVHAVSGTLSAVAQPPPRRPGPR